MSRLTARISTTPKRIVTRLALTSSYTPVALARFIVRIGAAMSDAVWIPVAALPWLLILFLVFYGRIREAMLVAFVLKMWLPWLSTLIRKLRDDSKQQPD